MVKRSVEEKEALIQVLFLNTLLDKEILRDLEGNLGILLKVISILIY